MGLDAGYGIGSLKPGVCTSSTRPTSPYEGQSIYETDTDRVLFWNNSAWVMIADTDTPPGLQLIRNGTFTTQDIIADSVFTTEYSRYLLKTSISLSNTAATLQVQFRTTGANNTTSNYVHQNTAFTTSTFYDRNTTATTSSLVAQNVGAQGWDIDFTIWHPASSTQSTRIVLTGGVNTGSVPMIGNTAFNSTTAFDGIRIFPSAGTLTGTYCLYGYRD